MKTPPHEQKPRHTARGEAQCAALVQAAYDLIAEKGFEGLRTRDVAERAGVNIATLHYYFKSKEDLIRGVVSLLRDKLMHTNHPFFQSIPRAPLEELRLELANVEYQLETIPEAFTVLLELHLRSLRDPAIKTILQEMDAGWLGHMSSYLADGVREGIFRADLDVAAAAAGLMAFVKGAMMQLIYNRPEFPASRVNVEVERWLTEHALAVPSHEPPS
jgi:AcrR family transcriptional regulator